MAMIGVINGATNMAPMTTAAEFWIKPIAARNLPAIAAVLPRKVGAIEAAISTPEPRIGGRVTWRFAATRATRFIDLLAGNTTSDGVSVV